MKNKALILFILLFLFSGASGVFSFDFWQHPEMAEGNTLFAGVFAASFSFTEIDSFFDSFEFNPELFFDFMLPLPLPFSFGFSTGLLNLKPDSLVLGWRTGYHINFDDPDLDAYVMHILKFMFVQDEMAKLKWSPAIGVRRRFGSFFCINLEADFMPMAFFIGFSIKLN